MKTFNAATRKIARLRLWFTEQHERQCAIRELCLMPGWRLRDLGIERDRIPEIVDGLIARRRALNVEEQSREADAGQAPGAFPDVSGAAPI